MVWFTNSKKGLALNRTNNRTIRGAYGDDTADWTGKIIAVFPTQADFRGHMVGALRVRIPPKENPKVTTGPQPTPKSPPTKAAAKATQTSSGARAGRRARSRLMTRSGSEQSGERGSNPLAPIFVCAHGPARRPQFQT